MGANIKQYAAQLAEAEFSGTGVLPITSDNAGLTIEEAYQIQLENIKRKVESGQKIVGKKIGLTSLAMQRLLGVDEPDYGHLLDSMVVENGGAVSIEKVLQPKVEAEIAFVLKKELKGPNVTALDVIQATDYVVPALEIVDSRIKDWKIKLPDTIADNASSGFYVLGGKPARLSVIDLKLIGMVLTKNGEVANTGVGAAALGNPINCVAWLANRLADFDISLKKGEVILSGALSAAVEAQAGDSFTARFAHIGQVSVHF
ncbi:2-keto-4-pentenoate hydratase [Bacillus sp. CMF12]|uniref:2-keto-4-pentenoate hydratase n=1 Tax=Bacillaceae TaxID=186817 RepID=UPI001FB2DB77|nr:MULTISPECIES: 2-keto-4-pentenoate hydratase [Bacillaceae]MDF2039372.1 2-keto-4-pentenoate hydratase [Cytobacillus oceanisediminis]UOE56831.1 fumarylacetoacetate hydrolase family protein [Cytobacillus oceanisediminis]USK51324.1 2-keto-4-pentenoate hydratase [Bacillus sp. CMF12]